MIYALTHIYDLSANQLHYGHLTPLAVVISYCKTAVTHNYVSGYLANGEFEEITIIEDK